MAAPGQNNVDLDALLDLTEYDGVSYHSPSLSPSTTSKPTFASPITAAVPTPNITPTNTQTLSGPSHNYDMYRQQTGFVPGAIANAMAVNQNNGSFAEFGGIDYMSTFTPENDLFDFNTSPAQNTMSVSEVDMEFDSPAETQQFFSSTINPSSIEQESNSLPSPPVVPTQTGNVGRLWPGAHSQAALAKAQAQAQQRQQQQMMQQQPQRQAPQQKGRSKSSQPTDPIVEQKITQLLNSMRAKPPSPDALSPPNLGNLPRSKKEEDDMDEDERLLASEEGKKLSSKERRQLRNKVSARAFRSRRKEYISQLESEIATKVNENGELRVQNRALIDENKRLSDLTRMLLSSPSFSNFLDHLSTNPSALPQGLPTKVEPQQQQQQQQDQRQIPKDPNPFGAQQTQQQIGMAMIPEQNIDFSMLTLDNSAYNFQPQVFVVDTPELPAPIDASMLSGKSSSLIEDTFSCDEEKIEVPVIERPTQVSKPTEQTEVAAIDEDFESDPDFALFHTESTVNSESSQPEIDELVRANIFGGIQPEKALSRYELVDATVEEASAAVAMARVQRISANIESVVSRLELLTMDL